MRLFQNWSSPKVYQRRILFEQLEERIVLDAAVTPQPTNTILDNPEPTNTQQSEQQENQVNLAAGVTVCPLPPPPTPAGEVFHQDLNVVLISNALDKIPEISQGAMDAAKVITYDALHDNLITIIGELQDVSKTAGQKIDNIAIIGHGAENAMRVGTDRIDFSNVGQFSPELSSLGQALSDNAQIQLFTCSLAKDASGKAFVDSIAKLTGADVYASDDNTGGGKGDWTLEYGSDSTVALKSLMDTQYLTNIHTDLTYAPELTINGTAHGAEDTLVDLSHLVSVKDQDANETVTVKLTANQGFSTLDAVAQTGATVTGHNTSTITVEGSQSAVNETLNHLTGALVHDWNSSDGSQATVLVHVSDSHGNNDGSASGTLYASVDTGPVETGQGLHVLVVSSAIQSSDQLVQAAADGVLTVTYDPTTDSPDNILLKIETTLAGHKADSIAFATHDQGPGQFYLTGDYSVNSSTLLGSPELQHFWKEVGSLVNDNGRIDLLACGLGSNEIGKLLLSQLESMVGRNFAASDDATGNAQYGGDWVLESDGIDVGPVYFSQPALDNFTSLLINTPPGLSLIHEAGSLDPTFGSGGKVVTDFSSSGSWESAHSVGIQPDGKIVVAGVANGAFALVRYNSDGSPDIGFNGDGKVTTNIVGLYEPVVDGANSVAIQSDWKIVVAGQVFDGSQYAFGLARYNSDGSLDTSFNGDGKVTTCVGTLGDDAYSVAIQPDGKILVAGCTLIGSNEDFALARYNSDGSLDTSFDGDGKATTDFNRSDCANAVAVQPDGKIVVAGYTLIDSNWDFALARYNSDGSLDTSFDGDGKVTTTIGARNDYAQSVAMTIQSDGKIVVAGRASIDSYDFALARYNSNGSLDTSFSGDGKATTDISGSSDFANSVAVQPDGKILVSGYAWNGASNDFALARYNSNGSLDTSFNGDGKATTDISGSYDQAYSVAVQPDGKIVVAGCAWNGASNAFALARYDASQLVYIENAGAQLIDDTITLTDVDSTNMSSGKIQITGNYQSSEDTLSIASGYSLPAGVTANWDGSTGQLALDGVATSTNYQSILAHVTYTNSSDDPNTNSRTVSWTIQDEGGLDSVPQTSSITVMAVDDGPTASGPVATTSLNEDGSISITVFGTDVDNPALTDVSFTITSDVHNGTLVAGDMAKDSDGHYSKVYTYTPDANFNGSDPFEFTFTTKSETSNDNNTTSVISVPITVTAVNDLPEASGPVATTTLNEDGTTSITVHGTDVDNPDLADVSFTVTSEVVHGTLVEGDTSLVSDGHYSKVYTYTPDANFNGSDPFEFTFTTKSETSPDNNTTSVVSVPITVTEVNDAPVLSLSHGAGLLDTTFSVDGKVTNDLGSSNDNANSVAIQADGKIVVAGNAGGDFGLARYNTDGTLDISFSGDGKVITGFGEALGASSVAIQADGKIVVAGYARNGSNYNFALARYNSDGSLDTTFDGDGKLTTKLGDWCGATDMTIQADGKIVVAGYSYNGSDDDFALARYNGDGSLDTSFDGDGKLTTDFGGLGNWVNSVAIQSDGKIVAAGGTYNGRDNDLALARYNGDGSLDTTFDSDGKLTTDFSGRGSNDWVNSVAIQGDGKIVVAANSLGSGSDFVLARYNGDGSLDTTFDSDGKLNTDFAGWDYSKSVTIQSDGKIVVAGDSYKYPNADFALARYNSDGSLDTTFDNDGKLTTAIGSSDDYANSVAIQTDGKIVVAGQTGGNFALARYDASHMDYTENASAQVFDSTITLTDSDSSNMSSAKIQITGNYQSSEDTLSITSGYSLPAGVTANWDGSTGQLTLDGIATSTNYQSILAHVTYTNSSDDPNTNSRTVSWTIQDEGGLDSVPQTGSITVTAVNDAPTASGPAPTTLNEDGSVSITVHGTDVDNPALSDVSFTITSDVHNGTLVAGDMAKDSDCHYSKVYTYTPDANFNGSDPFEFTFTTKRETSSATDTTTAVNVPITVTAVNDAPILSLSYPLDPTFGTSGVVTTDFTGAGAYDSVYSVAIQTDGKIVAAGYAGTYVGTHPYFDFALARYNIDGSLDTSFGLGGKVTTGFGDSSGYAKDLVIQADGKIVAAGFVENGANNNFALARYNIDGSLDASFGLGGKVTTDLGHGLEDWINSVAIQTDGKIVAAGSVAWYSDWHVFALARYNVDGSLDTSFGLGGKVTTNLSGSTDSVSSLAIQPDGKIVAAGPASGYFGLARYNVGGSLDMSFGVGGKLTTDIIYRSYDTPYSVTIQTDGKIVVAGGSNEEFELARYNSNGSLDTTFSDDGKVTTDFNGYPYAVTAQADGKFVVAGFVYNGSNDDFTVARYNSNGSLDTGFGKLTTDISGRGLDNGSYSVTIQADGKIVTAGYVINGSNEDFAVARYDLSQMVYIESTGQRKIDSGITVADIDSVNMASATIHIASNYHSDEDTLSIAPGYSLPDGVTMNWNGLSGTLMFQGVATTEDYQSILEHVTYNDSSNSPNTSQREVTWTVNDGTLDSATQTSAITITATNDLPEASGPGVATSLNEDGTVSITVYGTDVDNPDLSDVSFAITSDVSNGILIEGDTSLVSLGHYSKVYTYTPTANFNGSDNFEFTFTTKSETSSSTDTTSVVNVPINVNDVNDAPLVSGPSSNIRVPNGQVERIDITCDDGDLFQIQMVTIILDSPPSNGTLHLTQFDAETGANQLHAGSVITAISNGGNQSLFFKANTNGSDTFTFHARDNGGGTHDTSGLFSVRLTVNSAGGNNPVQPWVPPNNPPTTNPPGSHENTPHNIPIFGSPNSLMPSDINPVNAPLSTTLNPMSNNLYGRSTVDIWSSNGTGNPSFDAPGMGQHSLQSSPGPAGNSPSQVVAAMMADGLNVQEQQQAAQKFVQQQQITEQDHAGDQPVIGQQTVVLTPQSGQTDGQDNLGSMENITSGVLQKPGSEQVASLVGNIVNSGFTYGPNALFFSNNQSSGNEVHQGVNNQLNPQITVNMSKGSFTNYLNWIAKATISSQKPGNN